MTAQAENLIIALALAAMMLIPLAESALRTLFSVGISGSTSIVQQLTLVVGMLGGAIAARDDRLLSLSTAQAFLRGRIRTMARIFAYSFGAAVSTFLCTAGVQFVMSKREAGAMLVQGVPLWWVQTLLPLGFAAIALRLVWHSAASWRGRGVALVMAGAVLLVCVFPPAPPSAMVFAALLMLLAATALGAPVFVALGGAALIGLWGAESPIASLSLDHYRQVVNPSYPTIPLFTLAGYFLAEGGASRRLIRVFQALFGHFRGGSAIVTALVCAFFTSFTGASGVTILALGGLLMPILLSAGYKERSALGLLTGAGSLGLLFPPCLPLILYAIVAQVTLREMFLGGLLPGMLLVAMTAWWGTRLGPPVASGQAFDWKEAWKSVWLAKWELLLPVVALASLFAGFATPVEAAALTAFYAFVVEVFVYRDLKIARDVPRVMAECGLLVGGVLLILGVALGFTNYLTLTELPARGIAWVEASSLSPWQFILLLNLFLIVVGCLMDIYSAIIVVVPLILPLGFHFNMDPVHLGILFLANLELGYLTPPVGMNLFLASYRFNKPMPEVIRASFPMLLVLLVGVLLIAYIPALTTLLPRWLGR